MRVNDCIIIDMSKKWHKEKILLYGQNKVI